MQSCCPLHQKILTEGTVSTLKAIKFCFQYPFSELYWLLSWEFLKKLNPKKTVPEESHKFVWYIKIFG